MRPYLRILAPALMITLALIVLQALSNRAPVSAAQSARTVNFLPGSQLSTMTPQPLKPTPTFMLKSTHAPRPTPTPIPTPPPTNPKTIQLMAAFGVLVVVVILFGIFINRRQAL